jgi:hypothetical protein
LSPKLLKVFVVLRLYVARKGYVKKYNLRRNNIDVTAQEIVWDRGRPACNALQAHSFL